MQTLFLATLALAAFIAPASADTLETAAAGAFSDNGLSSQMKSSGAGISANSFDMGRTLQDRGGCCRDRGGDHGRGGGDRDRGGDSGYGRRRENGVDRTEREDRQRDERERRDKERRDAEWDRFKKDWDSKHPGQPYPDNGRNNGGGGNGSADRRGSQGWGYDARWQWREGRAFWWGWEPFIVVGGTTHNDCMYYYIGLRNRCAADCDYGRQGCYTACDYNNPGDPSACKARCETPYNACTTQCAADQQVWTNRCPL